MYRTLDRSFAPEDSHMTWQDAEKGLAMPSRDQAWVLARISTGLVSNGVVVGGRPSMSAALVDTRVLAAGDCVLSRARGWR